MSYVPGRRIGKRVHAYDLYRYMRIHYGKTMANEFVTRTKNKHPIIYKKELEPNLK